MTLKKCAVNVNDRQECPANVDCQKTLPIATVQNAPKNALSMSTTVKNALPTVTAKMLCQLRPSKIPTDENALPTVTA